MESDTAGVVLAGTPCFEILLIGVERFGHGKRPTLIHDLTRLAAGELPGDLLSLPVRQHVRRRGGLQVVGEPDAL